MSEKKGKIIDIFEIVTNEIWDIISKQTCIADLVYFRSLVIKINMMISNQNQSSMHY